MAIVATTVLLLNFFEIVEVAELERLVLAVLVSAPLAALFTDMVNKRNYDRPRLTKRTALQSRLVQAGISEGVAFALLKVSDFIAGENRPAIESCLEECSQIYREMITEYGDEFPMVRLEMLSVEASVASLLTSLRSDEGAESLERQFRNLQQASRNLDSAVSKKAMK